MPSGFGDTEKTRVRRLTVLLYLCDGSLEVHEPRVENSGLAQGVFLGRARVAKPDGTGPLTPSDLSVGALSNEPP